MTTFRRLAVAVIMAGLAAGTMVMPAAAQNHHGEKPAMNFLRKKAMRHHYRHHRMYHRYSYRRHAM